MKYFVIPACAFIFLSCWSESITEISSDEIILFSNNQIRKIESDYPYQSGDWQAGVRYGRIWAYTEIKDYADLRKYMDQDEISEDYLKKHYLIKRSHE